MGLLDQMQPTPRNRMLGLLADALTAANDYTKKPDPTMPGGLANPPLAALSGLLGLPAVATTAQRMSYGEPLTNISKANVPLLRPETAEALMTVAPLAMAAAPYVGRGMQKAAPYIADAAMPKYQAVGGGVGGKQGGAIVWHGSPHKFDKFDSSKIGTGEGAQAYGHGLYLAEKPDVAGAYIQAGRNLGFENWDDPIRLANKAFGNASGDVTKAIEQLDSAIASTKPGSKRNNLIFAKQALQRGAQNASIYKVDITDENIAKMLDWDKPLSQQAPDVLAAIKSSKAGRDFYKNYGQDADYGEAFYRYLSEDKRMGGKAAETLRSAGIPGIRYLDGGSRSAGSGTSNYVVFPGNEGLLQILERNGVPLGK